MSGTGVDSLDRLDEALRVLPADIRALLTSPGGREDEPRQDGGER
jgi:hypothetical protein